MPYVDYASLKRREGLNNMVRLKKVTKPAVKTRRAWQRYGVFLKARYVTKSSCKIKACIVINLGRGGACLLLPQNEIISKGIKIFLQVLTMESERISIKGEIVWFKKIENVFIAGVKFIQVLNMNTLKKLNNFDNEINIDIKKLLIAKHPSQ